MKHCAFLAAFLIPYALISQSIMGKVSNENNEVLVGASVYWVNSNIGTTTGFEGEFELPIREGAPRLLVASYVGHVPDTIEVNDQTFVRFKLKDAQTLNEAVVRAKRDGVLISDTQAIKTEQITQTELGKSACCDLASSQLAEKPSPKSPD